MILAETSTTSIRWHALPPLWVLVLVLLPLVLFGVRFFYRREAGRVGHRLRIAMGGLRAAAILLVLAALFGPYAETIEGLRFKRHLILCVDTSRSMDLRDLYGSNPELAEAIRGAAGYDTVDQLSTRSRLQIVQDVIGRDRSYLEKLAERFRLHVYAFDSSTVNLMEPREGETTATTAERLVRVLPQLQAQGAVTRIGTAIGDLVKDFDARNEPVAGILLFTDGRHTGAAPSPAEEPKRAAPGTPEGIRAVLGTKGRAEEKPLLVLVESADSVSGLAWTPAARELASIFWPGSVTLVLGDPDESFPTGVRDPVRGTVGVRVSPHPVAARLVRALGAPLTSTSLNVPGQAPVTSAAEAREILARMGAAEAWLLDAGTLPPSAPSTVVDCSTQAPAVLREGAVPTGRLRCVIPDLT